MKKTTLMFFMFFMFFISLCGYAQLAEEGFEGTWTTLTGTASAGGPTGWAIKNVAGPVQYWIQGNGGGTQPAYEGTHSAYLNLENVASGTTSEDWLITKSFPMPEDPQLRFFSKLFLGGDQGTQYKIMISTTTTAGTVAEQTDATNYTQVTNWTELTLNPSQTDWTEKVVSLSSLNIPVGTQVYIAFVMMGDNGDRWDIDKVKVVKQCLDPTGLNAINVGMTTADLTWTNPSGSSSWEIELLPQSGTPTGTGITYNGTLPFQAGTAGSGVTLTANTDYKYYVRSLCSDGGISNWVGPYSFSTVALGESCAAPIVIATLPYSTTDDTSNYASNNYTGSPGASGCGVTFGYLGGNDVVYAYTAPATGVISLDVTNNAAYSGMFVYDSCANIGVSCIGGSTASFTPTPLSIPTLSVTAGTTYYIVISTWPSPQTTPYTLTIQQVNCLPPVGLPTTNIGQTSADLSWTNPSGATSWQIYVQSPAGGIPSGSGTTVTDNTNYTVSQTATGAALVTASPYEYYVRADCGNGTFSAWAGPYQFNTTICEVADQCTYTFIMTDAYGDGWNGNTMTVSQNGITIATLALTDYTTGPVSVPVQVCDGVPIQLYWNSGGSYATEVGVSIQNGFAQTFYTKPAGTGTPNTVLYTGTVDCDNVMCLPPTELTATNIGTTTVDLGWAGPATGSWEYYVVAAGSPAPTTTTAGTATTTNPTVGIPVTQATNYDYYVRMICDGNVPSDWTPAAHFSSSVCEAVNKCDYTFVMTSDWWIGYSGATMVISQNGTTVATIGSTFTTGQSQSVTVPLCTDTPFQVYWANGGNSYYQVGLQIINSFEQTLYTLLPYNGSPGTVLYTSNADCLTPACLPPTGLSADNETMTTIDLSWDGPATGSWEYYIVNVDANEAAPTDTSTPSGSTLTNPAVGVSLPSPATNYEYYVRIVCADDAHSTWAGPYTFHSAVCEAANQCTYTFEMQSQNGWGWEGNTMTIYQSGVPVATIGDSYTYGMGNSATVQVPLCADTEISIYWNTTGYDAYEKGLIVYSPFMEDIYVKPFGTGAQGTTLYTGIPSCTPPLCPKPQNLAVVGSPGLTSTDITWTEMGTATQWEVTVVAYQADAPDPTAPIVTTNITTSNTYTVTPLESGTTYSVYVRALCGGDNGNSTWSGPLTFTTALVNDDCSGAIDVPVNPGADCDTVVTGTVTGSTGSGLVPSCNSWSTIDYDAWFSFVATGTSHAVNINNQVGAYFYFTVYEGDGCGNLTEFACGYNSYNILTDLTPGSTYYVMVYTTYMNNPSTITSFDVCVTTPEPPITTSTTQYTVEELITDVFIGSECALVTNITSFTGTDYGYNGIGSFDQNGSSFPFSAGVVLVAGNVSEVPGPNDTTIGGYYGWPGDADLENAVGLPAGNTHDSSWIQFDFAPLVDMPLSFDFIFASEEYGTPSFECFYSDAFAFILTDLETNVSENLAVLPGTSIPILVTNVHLYNDSCGEANPTLFGQYNGPLSPINFNGQLVPITATSSYTLQANHQYRMKMVVANKGDDALSSGVFLLQHSFNLGEIDLGLDMTLAGNNAVCSQGTVTLNSNLDPALHTFIWYQDGVVMDGETGPTLLVTEPGVYTLDAPVNNTTCVRHGHVTIEFYPAVEVITENPVDMTACDADGYATFDLTPNTATILTGLDSTLYTVTYYPTEADANAQTNAIANPAAYQNVVQFQQTVYVRIVRNIGQCFAIKSFNLIIQDLTPQFTIDQDFSICEGTTDATITVTPTNYDPADVTYSWTHDGVDLGVTVNTVPVTGAGAYVVTINHSGCIATATVNVTVTPIPVADDPIDVTSCDSYVLPALSPNNAYYTEANGGGILLSAGESITSTQEIHILATSGTTPACTSENVFTVTINPSPVIVEAEVQPVVACDKYTLPALTVGSYFTQAGGAGTPIAANTEIASTQTIYVYAETATTPNCTDEANFTVTITPTPVADDPADVSVCDSYTLPELSAGNVYYTGPGATGTVLNAGEVIIDNQVIYVHAQSATNADCTSENSFSVTIVPTPEIDDVAQYCNDDNQYELAVAFLDNLYTADNATFAWTGPDGASAGTGITTVITAPGTYHVTVTPIDTTICPVEGTVVVDDTSCEVQRGISPNNDGKNDSFDLSGLNVRKLEIFNRYGQEVFSKRNYSDEWYGQTDNGEDLPTGTYFYMFERTNGETKTGWIYINRQVN